MPEYLLTCSCGKQIPVGASQAGGRVNCECGQLVDVPPLRNLRSLPIAESVSDRAQPEWTFRHGLATALIVAAVVLAAVGGYFVWRQITLSRALPRWNVQERKAVVDQNLSEISPKYGWDLWVQAFRPLRNRGFAAHPGAPELEQFIRLHSFYWATMFGLAGVCFVVGVAIYPRKGRSSSPSTR